MTDRRLVAWLSAALLAAAACGGKTDTGGGSGGYTASGGSGGGNANVCERACTAIEATGCREYPTHSECVADCEAQRAQGGCSAQFDAFVGCILSNSGFTCSGGGVDVSDTAMAMCATQADAFQSCVVGGYGGSGGSGGGPSGGSGGGWGGGPAGGSGGAGAYPGYCSGFLDCCYRACELAMAQGCPDGPQSYSDCECNSRPPDPCSSAYAEAYACILQHVGKSVICDDRGGVAVTCGPCDAELQGLSTACGSTLECSFPP